MSQAVQRALRLALMSAAIGTSVAGCAQPQDCAPPPNYGPPPGPYPNLTEAEGSLQSAIMSLRQAPPVFGGHKAEAVRLIESAINEIEAGKAAAP